MSTTLTEIPVIDFTPFLTGTPAEKQQVVEQIHHAFHAIGFLYLRNFNVAADLVEQLFAQSRRFFDLPSAAKNQLAWADEFSNRGYVGIERERLDPSQPGDLKEAFNVGQEVAADDPLTDQFRPLAQNRWPEGDEAFRTTVLAFYAACTQAASDVLRAIALSLDLPEDFFISNHSQHPHTLRLLHYPPTRQPAKPGQGRAGSHSDYGSITLLFQDAIGGLEVRTTQGEWLEAPTLPGTVIVNTGDMMQRWTNHEFCSTQHRVRIPADDRASQPRYSAAFFCHPNDETEIACIESCQGIDRPALYPPITAKDYLLSRLRTTY